MPPKFLEHALILTHDSIATQNWSHDALGLTEGQAPDFGFPVHWVYMVKHDVVRIAPAGGSDAQNACLGNDKCVPAMGSGRMDHICFNVGRHSRGWTLSAPSMRNAGQTHPPTIRSSLRSH